MKRLFSYSFKRGNVRLMTPEQQIQEVKTRNIEYSRLIDKDLLADNRAAHKPSYFVLTCVDSRIMPADIMGMVPGDVLVHRNIANRFPEEDLSVNSAVTFATEILGIKHLIVMGHQDCGGLAFSMTDNNLPYLGDYLKKTKEAYNAHKHELDNIEDKWKKNTKLAEYNALMQAERIFKHPVVQQKRNETGYPKVYATIYWLEDGLLRDLGFEENILNKDI